MDVTYVFPKRLKESWSNLAQMQNLVELELLFCRIIIYLDF